VVPKFRDLFASLDPAQTTTVDPRLLVDGGRQGITWPNDAVAVPDGIFPTKGILVTSGFLLPFPKKTGHIQFVEWETGAVTRLDAQRKDREGWFYYHAEWRDMNGDGRLDIVTARAHKPLRGDAEGELLWLEQPMKDAGAGAWQEHVLTPGPNPQGPDANFRFADLDGDGQDEIVAPQFFTGVLSVLWQEGGSWRSRAVDTTVTGYDVQVVDLNGDGRDDVVVSDAEHTNGSLVAYEVPRDFRREPWVRHELGSGYAGRNKWVSYATAPGPVLVSWRQAGVRSGKPVLVVSGENEGTLRVFQPKSEDPTRWDYDDPIVFEAKKGTVGYPAVADMNGDGFDDIVVPAYDDGLLEVLTFAPDGTTP
jgi:hypothetical protein